MQPERSESISDAVKALSIGESFGAVVDVRGTLHVWGTNRRGELGLNDYERRSTPTPITSLRAKHGRTVKHVAVGATYALAIGEDKTFSSQQFAPMGRATSPRETAPPKQERSPLRHTSPRRKAPPAYSNA